MQFLHTVYCGISLVFTINVGIGTYFVYCIYINPSKKVVNNKNGSVILTLIY